MVIKVLSRIGCKQVKGGKGDVTVTKYRYSFVDDDGEEHVRTLEVFDIDGTGFDWAFDEYGSFEITRGQGVEYFETEREAIKDFEKNCRYKKLKLLEKGKTKKIS